MSKNNLINALPKEMQELVLENVEIVDLTLSQIICVFDKPVASLYFPIDGFISITQSIDMHPPLEIGMIGREGMLGSEVMLGDMTNPFGALVQGSGSAWRMDVNVFLSHLKNFPEFKTIVNNYLTVRISQLGLSTACEHFHEIGPRLAKWLLMSQDRAHSPTFQMTHEFIALMLGVRRVGITTTAADFRRRGLIEYHRGEMKVLNRSALKAEACSCYQKNRKIYSSFIE
jgi:CRP-like cAMP-binding protein